MQDFTSNLNQTTVVPSSVSPPLPESCVDQAPELGTLRLPCGSCGERVRVGLATESRAFGFVYMGLVDIWRPRAHYRRAKACFSGVHV